MNYFGKEKIFQPMQNLSDDVWKEFEQHYGENVSREEIIQHVYGGQPLNEIFSHIEFKSEENDIENTIAKITLKSAIDSQPDLVLSRISMKQFLVSGLPDSKWLPWDGNDHWEDVNEQYRLELCHSEVSRWSIVFKKDNVINGGANILGDKNISYIELVNNCTTVTGFEFKIKIMDILYHGSFGYNGNLESIYSALSQKQAGSLARQLEPLDNDQGPSFFNAYFNPLDYDNSININLNKYRGSKKTGNIRKTEVNINRGDIDYKRWGDNAEYYHKPFTRKLIHSINGINNEYPPELYSEIECAQEIALPNFQPTGIYDLSDPQVKKNYSLLYQLTTCELIKYDNNLYDIQLINSNSKNLDQYGIKRIIIGNIFLDDIPVYPDYFTFNRFDFGSRDTTMDYDPNFSPTSESCPISHYAYILAGKKEPKDAIRYVCPEGFGVERIILSWEDITQKNLVIDIISFERILPVWQGVVCVNKKTNKR